MPTYGKQFERDIKRSMAEAAAEEALKPNSTTDDAPHPYPFEKVENDELPF